MSNTDNTRSNSIQNQPNAGKGGFGKNPQNINRTGLNRKLVSTTIDYLESIGVKKTSAEEIKDVYLRLLNITEAERDEMANDKEMPLLLKGVISAMKSGKGWEVIKDMIERSIGKSEANVKIESNVIQVVVPEDSAFDEADKVNKD